MLKIQLKHPFEASHWLVEKNFTIGSAPENNLVLNDPSVSPVHAKITNQRGAFLLSDCDSKYGSFLNEEKISQVQIGRYDVIRIGNIDIEVVDPLRERESSAYQWSLVSTNGTMAGQELRIRPQKENKIKIGRGRQCDISFPGTQLAKEHIELNIKEESIELVDLNTTTGTFVNNERIKEATLKAGDMLRLDIHNFRIFGPGYEMPRSATVSPPPKSEEPTRRPRPTVVEA
ncbi:MAG: FHA domain-containing protein, partial [Pirellulales bacterium]|nr:FHA domain-containing protein [Pirellulales bacterium]